MPGQPVIYRELLPGSGEYEIDGALDAIFAELEPQDDRPYTLVNFVASADGHATSKGRSGALGDEGDRTLFHALRERVDAVLAGTTTMATERYGRILGKAERRERRTAMGLAAEPLACLFSRTGRVPSEIPLFAEPSARIAVFCGREPEPPLEGCAADVRIFRLPAGEVSLSTAMRCLREECGVRTLLCEGGPTLFGALLGERLVDDFFLTLAPKLVGGGHGPAVTAGPELPEPETVRLRSVLEREGSLFLRYGVS